jgi:hypothetical protein
MSESDGSRWGFLALVGAMGFCCIGTAALVGGAALAGGSAAGVTAVSGTAGGLGGIIVSGLATALPLLAIGLFLRHRAQNA